MRIFLSALAAAALAAPVLAAEPGPRQITVAGHAEVEAAPDLAMVTTGVETQATNAADALAANADAMAAVFQAIAAVGVEDRDRQTSQLSLDPVWSNPREGEDPNATPDVVAYRATNMVTIRVRNVASLGDVVDAVTRAGANRLYGVSFDLADPRTALDAARTRAVADARARAELYTGAAGVKLGAVREIRESGGNPGPVMFRAEAMASPAPTAAGTVAIGADVEVVYDLE